MNVENSYPLVQSVHPLADKKLHITFSTGESRIYDCAPLLKENVFCALADEELFQQVHADPHGYAVIWNDEIDLAESELWINGKPIEQDEALLKNAPQSF